MEEAINAILKDVTHVPKCGHPGTFVVFESNAYPILTGMDPCDIVVAAAEYNQGRVLALSHEAYLERFLKLSSSSPSSKFETFWLNIKNWLIKNEPPIDEDQAIQSIENYESVTEIPPNVKIITWNGNINKSELFINQLLKKFVANGGSVLCGICPWGWVNSSRRTLDDLSINIFLSLVGICATSEPCKLDSNCIEVKKNQARRAHFGHAVHQLTADITRINELASILNNGITSLPRTSALKHLDRIHKLFYSNIVLKYMPTMSVGVKCEVGRTLLVLCSKLYQKYSTCGLRIKAPNIDEFPGDFTTKPETTTAIITVKSKFDEFHCTGYYAAAGSAITITVLEGNPTGWDVRIGCHTDDLSSMRCLNRWPIVSSCVKLIKTMTVTTAFGGLVYLDSPKGNSTLRLKLESVVEAPFFDLTKPETVKSWSVRRNAPGLWTELCGRNIIFTVPSSSIRNLENPTVILKLWDLIITANHELRGTDAKNTWRERIVVDVQPLGGSMNSGYPIVISYDQAYTEHNLSIFNAKSILTNGWSLLHELGHNMLRQAWTPTGTEEVMPNIFALHALDYVFKDNKWLERFTSEIRVEKLLKDCSFTFAQWSSEPKLAFFVYLQLVSAFGWNAFKTVFREYEGQSGSNGGVEILLLRDDLSRWTHFVVKFSQSVGLNVSPLLRFWDVPFAGKTVSESLKSLPAWLPDDRITKFASNRVRLIRAEFEPDLLIGNENLYSSCPKVVY